MDGQLLAASNFTLSELRGPGEPDPFTILCDQAPTFFWPVTDYHYSNQVMDRLSYALLIVLRGQPHEDVRSLMTERVIDPIGMDQDHCSCGYGETNVVDGMLIVANCCGGNTARTVACVDRLMLRNGDWDGKRLITSDTIDEAMAYAGTPISEAA